MGLNRVDFIVDHEDRDKLNNQRYNLREATYSQNNANSLPKSKRFRFKGIYEHTQQRIRPYYAEIRVNGEVKRLGNFATEEEAAKAYDKAALKYHGVFALTNYPKETYQ
jgi:hypothetical protein